MLVKNWHRMFFGRAGNFTAGEMGLRMVNGTVQTGNDALGGLMIYHATFAFPVSSAAAPYMGRFIKGSPVGYTSWGGVAFGDGSTPVSFDDYTLAGQVHTAYDATASISKSVDDDGATITALYTITNNSDVDMVIAELGLFHGYNNVIQFMVERTVLDSPVTIPAGGVGQITYTIRMNYPTA